MSERIHHIRGKPKDRDALFAGIAQDKAIHAMVRLCNVLHDAGLRIVLCSGCTERYRAETIEWLARHAVRYHELRLRRDGDRRSDTVAKREMLTGLVRARILFIVEDRARVVEMWRKEGFVCL